MSDSEHPHFEHTEHPSHPVPHEKKNSLALSLPAAIIVAGVIIAGAIVLVKQPVSTDAAAVANAGSGSISIRPPSASDHIIGSPNAPIVIVEFADFQCPYCSLIYPELKQIVSQSNGQIAWVYRNFPLDSIHPNARPAAEAAECIAALGGNADFWKFADADFANQSSLSSVFYASIASSLGIDMTKYQSCVSSKEYDSRINTDEAEAVENGGEGTPFTIILSKNNKPVSFSGALPLSEIQIIIQSLESTSTSS